MDPNAIGGQFTAAAQAYASGIQPYATRLFAALLFIEILVTAIQYMTDQGDAPRYVGRLFRHLFSAGFIYLMLINAFPWMTGVMKSFSAIGASVSGVPNLSPSTVLDLGGQMAETIYNTPASTGMIPNFSMALGQTVAAFFILLSFTIIAALALLVVIEMYLVVGGASILLAFGGSRFTAPIAEGYFGYVIKAGVRLLFFYLVLGIGVKIATQWNSALVAACVPATTILPWFSGLGAGPSSIITKVCSAPMNWPLLLNLVANSIILAVITTVVPSTAAGIVSGTAGLALNQAFEAAFIARTIIQPISSMMQAVGNKAVRALGANDGSVEARFRANEGIQAPRMPADQPEARVGAAPSTAASSDPNAETQVLNSKLTRQMGPGGSAGGGSTRYIGGNGKATSTMPSGSRGTAKI
jgi:P-type conjugative transfer protein TrbL